jgi:hypothetical protein
MKGQNVRLAVALICSLALVSLAPAQSNFATITGNVTDASGAGVPNARLEAVNVANNYRYTGQSDGSGSYTIVNLLEGTYRVRVTASGFQEQVIDAVTLASRDLRRIDVKLTVGAVSTTVEVTSESTLIETETARVSDIKERVVLRALPLTLRRIHDMWALQPGAYSGRLGGSRNKQRDFAFDGVTLSSATGGQTTGVMTDRTEAYEEVRIDVAGTTAEFAGIGQVAITTRSGSNQIHGAAFNYYQTPRLISRNPFAQAGTGSVEHIPGFSFGGPVWLPKIYNGRDRTFFFTSFESERLGSPNRTNRQLSVPLESWRRGDFSRLLPATAIRDPFNSNTPFPGNIIPATRINPVAAKMQTRYPVPNFGDTTVFSPQNWREIQLTDKHKNPTFTARLDHRFSEKTFAFARLTEIYWTQDGRDGSGMPYYGWTTAYRHDRAVNANFTRVFSPRLVAEIRWGYAFDITPSKGFIRGLEDIRELGLTGLAPNLPDLPGSFAVSFSTGGFTGLSSNGFCDPCNYNLKQHYQGHVSWFRGRHAMKFGYDIGAGFFKDYRQGAALWGSHSYSNRFTNHPYSDFLLGLPTTASRDYPANLQHQRTRDYAFFITDEFKVSPKLTVNAGMRYEVKPGFTSPQGRMAMFEVASGKIVVPNGSAGQVSPLLPRNYVDVVEASALGLTDQALIHTDTNNFAPRIGFAFRPWGNRTVFRGGAGIYYDFTPRTLTFENVPFRIAEPSFTNPATNPTVVLPMVFPTSVAGPATISIPAAVNPDIRIPYSMQYTFTIERQQWDIGWRASYIGTNTRQGVWGYDFNQPVADTRAYINKPRAFPNYPGITYLTNGAGHQFNSLTLEAERANKGGFYWQAYFSLARDIGDLDDSQTPEDAYNRKREKAVWPDIPKYRFNFNTVYELPFGKGRRLWASTNRVASALISNWELGAIYSAQTGTFLTPLWTGPDPTGTRFTASATAPQVTIRPNHLRDGNLDVRTPQRWFDASAFGAPTPGFFGTAAKGVIYGPGWNIIHGSLHKYVNFGERARLRLGCTTSNVANRPHYTDPAMNISTPATVGTITGVRALGDIDKGQPRVFQLTVRLDW